MLRRLLAFVLRLTRRRSAPEVARASGTVSGAWRPPPPPPAPKTIAPSPPPPAATRPLRLLFDDGTQLVVRADPVIERRIKGVLEAIAPPAGHRRASL